MMQGQATQLCKNKETAPVVSYVTGLGKNTRHKADVWRAAGTKHETRQDDSGHWVRRQE